MLRLTGVEHPIGFEAELEYDGLVVVGARLGHPRSFAREDDDFVEACPSTRRELSVH